jgi:hypothetical protein
MHDTKKTKKVAAPDNAALIAKAKNYVTRNIDARGLEKSLGIVRLVNDLGNALIDSKLEWAKAYGNVNLTSKELESLKGNAALLEKANLVCLAAGRLCDLLREKATLPCDTWTQLDRVESAYADWQKEVR